MDHPDSPRDDLLILQCQQGDVASFDQLVRRWQEPLLNYTHRLTGDRAAAQDIVQETWMVVIRGLLTLKDVTRFRAWLYRIASHKCQDHWRRKRVRQQVAEELQQQSATPAGPANANQSEVDAAFRRLPPESRVVLALMYLEDFSIGEMARVLSLPEGTVKSRLFHARQQLRQLMEKDYGTN